MTNKISMLILALVILSLVFAPMFAITYLAVFDAAFSWARGFALVSVSMFGVALATSFLVVWDETKKGAKGKVH
jgi:hypothetical protein